MIVKIVAFSARGGRLAGQLQSSLSKEDIDASAYCFYKYADEVSLPPVDNLKNWCGENWDKCDGIVFVSACGIAVRSIAPYIKSKKTDPAVVVLDETGKFSISLLSGHIGGANELAETVAALTGATAVVTTASDVNGKIAIDVLAEKNNLFITSMYMAKQVAAAILAGEKVGFFSDLPLWGTLPEYFTFDAQQRINVYIGIKRMSDNFLRLVPKNMCLGMGCKRGTPQTAIENAVEDFLNKHDISKECINKTASIDLKKDEAGLLGFCEKNNLPITFYTNEQLNELQGEFSDSEFVRKTTGVGCVCERSAVKSAGGKLFIGKTKYTGITLALAGEEMRIKI